ncbi:MAG: AraC family ligand binding domain-containing protein, partial [Lachnospiraceae bacterium]|nr:AraC family ligand binding domain-containing protein [Lachnospiraceae bacterium]
MDDNMTVQSDRVIGTPSALAKSCFYYVQETGYLKSIRSHISKREKMKSFLFVYVLSGEGVFTVRNKKIKAHKGAAFFVDCMEAYSHETEPDGSWELLWVHFNGSSSL